jgi:hypothetical protein
LPWYNDRLLSHCIACYFSLSSVLSCLFIPCYFSSWGFILKLANLLLPSLRPLYYWSAESIPLFLLWLLSIEALVCLLWKYILSEFILSFYQDLYFLFATLKTTVVLLSPLFKAFCSIAEKLEKLSQTMTVPSSSLPLLHITSHRSGEYWIIRHISSCRIFKS